MKRILIDILRPVSQRIATATGAWLAGVGMTAADIQTVQAALIILCGFGIDLIVRRLY